MHVLQNPGHENGLVPSPIDVRDFTIAKSVKSEEFPKEFVLDLIPVKNQYATPSCAAFAGSEIVEYFNQTQKKNYVEFSTEFIYGTRKHGYYIGDGMSLRDVCNTLLCYGDVPVADMVGNHDYELAMANVAAREKELIDIAFPNRVSAYFKLETEEEMKHALMEYGYLLVNMNTYEGAYVSKDGIYVYDAEKPHGSHAVVLYGWNDTGWLMQNSWGIGWGKQGRCVIPYGFKFNEVWGLSDNIIEDGEFRSPFSGRFIGFIARIINVITNLFRRKRRNSK